MQCIFYIINIVWSFLSPNIFFNIRTNKAENNEVDEQINELAD